MQQTKANSYGPGHVCGQCLSVGKSSIISIPLPKSLFPLLLSSSVLSAFLIIAPIATAQIIPDATLNQNSRVEAGCTTCFIEGGTTVGTTLFHSFEAFSVPTGSRTFFVNATSISDIISRVTGDSISNIDGRIDTVGEANLFLLNPNGVIFGPNATLSISGSFLATTADRFEFANGQIFSAINPEPAPANLTISTPIGLQFGADPGAIAINGSTLRGIENQTLAWVGGALTISNANIRAIPGQIELGSVGPNSAIAIETNSNNAPLELNYDDTESFQDIELEQASSVNVSGRQGGRIQIQGNRITIKEDTRVEVNASQTIAGNIYIRAAESLDLIGENFEPATGIFNTVSESASADDNSVIRLEAPRIVLSDGAEVSTNTNGNGNGARLEVIADDILLDGGLSTDEVTPSGFFARTNASFDPEKNDDPATGNGGEIFIQSDRLTLLEGAQISTSTFGQGDAGDIEIQVSEQIEVSGQLQTEEKDLFVSGIFAQVEVNDSENTGNGGTIRLNTPILRVTGGAQIATAARSTGKGGNIFINDSIDNAQLVLLSGTADIDRDDNISGILVSAEEGARNNAGSLVLNAEQLIVEEGARISADNRGSGQGGSANLTVQELIVQNGGQILAASFANNPNGPEFDPATATTGGNAGNLTINSRTIEMNNGGEISVQAEADANAGTIKITVETLDILDSIISASAEQGIAGSITINTTGSEVFVSGHDAAIAVEATGARGEAGDLIVNTEGLDISNGATLSVSAPQGTAGNLKIGATTIVLDNGTLSAETQQTPDGETGANINITGINTLFLTNDSLISASALDQADGGNVTLDASQGFITSPVDVNSDILASAVEGNGGEINITTQGLFGLQERPRNPITNDINASSDFGLDGDVNINGLEIDPSRGLIALPSGVVDVSRLIAQQCNAGGYAERQRSDFVITGRGGLVPAPGELMGQSLWDDMRSPFTLTQSATPSFASSPPSSSSLSDATRPPLIEAQAWTQTPDGQILLIAQTSTPHQTQNTQWQTTPTCTQ